MSGRLTGLPVVAVAVAFAVTLAPGTATADVFTSCSHDELGDVDCGDETTLFLGGGVGMARNPDEMEEYGYPGGSVTGSLLVEGWRHPRRWLDLGVHAAYTCSHASDGIAQASLQAVEAGVFMRVPALALHVGAIVATRRLRGEADHEASPYLGFELAAISSLRFRVQFDLGNQLLPRSGMLVFGVPLVTSRPARPSTERAVRWR